MSEAVPKYGIGLHVEQQINMHSGIFESFEQHHYLRGTACIWTRGCRRGEQE
jgi:hypothetical protein